MESSKILFVDDEQNLLSGIRRQFRREFDLSTAACGQEGLDVLQSDGPFAVIVSDLRMPGMDGIEFLSKARDIYPDSVRMMLTGNADLTAAMQAVNEGSIFRFMSKPCPTEVLRTAITAGLDQYRLIRSERELLENTLHGSIKLLTDLLTTISPMASGRATRVKRYVKQLVRLLPEHVRVDKGQLWQFEVAAMLSQVGSLLLPQGLLKKANDGESLTPEEKALFGRHPSVGRQLVTNIPRLEEVADVIAMQDLQFDSANGSPGAPKGENIPLAARILKVALDFDALVNAGNTQTESLAILQSREGWYDPTLLAAVSRLADLEATYKVVRVRMRDVEPSMILAENAVTNDGQLLVAKGFELTESMIQRLRNYSQNQMLREPLCVIVPISTGPPVTAQVV